jgi:hypothetical protein
VQDHRALTPLLLLLLLLVLVLLPVQDWVYHHALTPRLPASTTAITITDLGSSSSSIHSSSWTLPQSDIVPGEQ